MTERTERGDDFEFDFFEDEPETQDAGETQRIRMPRVGGPKHVAQISRSGAGVSKDRS